MLTSRLAWSPLLVVEARGAYAPREVPKVPHEWRRLAPRAATYAAAMVVALVVVSGGAEGRLSRANAAPAAASFARVIPGLVSRCLQTTGLSSSATCWTQGVAYAVDTYLSGDGTALYSIRTESGLASAVYVFHQDGSHEATLERVIAAAGLHYVDGGTWLAMSSDRQAMQYVASVSHQPYHED